MADTKISALSSLTKATVASNDLVPVVDTSASATKQMTYQELVQPQDDQFAITDNADNTKKVAFQVSGVTTGTTRTLTVPDANTTIVGTDATQTLTNKTLTSPQINMGTNATGDTYYRDSGGTFQRLPIGSASQILQVSSGGIPEWVSNPSASDSSTTVKGVVEIATTAEITAGTSTGGTGAKLVVPADAVGSVGASKIVQFNSSTQYPAADGSLITNIPKTKIDIAYTDVTVSNTNVETTLYSATIPANSLSTNNGVRLRMFLSLKKASTSPNFNLRFKYGATTLITFQINDATTFSTAKKGWVEFVVLATGATGTQEGSVIFNLVPDNQLANSTVVQYCMADVGTSSVDSTSNQTLAVTVQFGGTSASDEALAYHSILEYIK